MASYILMKYKTLKLLANQTSVLLCRFNNANPQKLKLLFFTNREPFASDVFIILKA